MPSTDRSHRTYTRKILTHVDSHQRITQRDLAHRLDIALGLTNLLIRRLVKKGWIEVVNVKPRGAIYLLTPAGGAAKARQTRNYLERTARLYTKTRETIRCRLQELSAGWPPPEESEAGVVDGSPAKRIVFYGAGDVAEIGYISLQSTDLALVGVVDDNHGRPFFGLQVQPPDQLSAAGLNGEAFGQVVIMSFKSAQLIRARLEKRGFPQERIFCL